MASLKAAADNVQKSLRKARKAPQRPQDVQTPTPAMPWEAPAAPQTNQPGPSVAQPAAPQPVAPPEQRSYTPTPAGGGRQAQQQQAPPAPAPAPRPPDPTSPVGSEERVQEEQEIFNWLTRRGDNLLDEIKGRSGRKYRRKRGPDGGLLTDASGRPIIAVEYSDDDGVTWVDAGSNFGQRASDTLHDAGEIIRNVPNFQKWYQNRDPEFGDWQNLGELADRVEGVMNGWGSLTERAREEAARMLGFDGFDADGRPMVDRDGEPIGADGEMAWFQGQVRDEMPTGVRGAFGYDEEGNIRSGFTEEEREAFDAQHMNQVRMLQEQSRRDIDAIYGESGSSMRALQVADGYRRQIQSAHLQHNTMMMVQDWARRESEFDAKMQRAALLEAQGIRGIEVASNMIVQDRAIQMQALSLQMSAAMAQNQQLQALHQGDVALAEMMANQLMALADRELGLDLAIQTNMDQLWERNVRPAMLQYESWFKRAQLGLQSLGMATDARMNQLAIESNERIAAEQAAAQREAGIFGFLGSLFGAVAGVAATVLTGGLAAPAIPALAAAGGSAGRGLALTP